jgi:hypothetical protein
VAEKLMIYNPNLDPKMVIYMPSKKYGNIMVFYVIICNLWLKKLLQGFSHSMLGGMRMKCAVKSGHIL